MAVLEKGLAKDQLSSPSLRAGMRMRYERESQNDDGNDIQNSLLIYTGQYALLSWNESKSEMWKNFDLVVDSGRQQDR